VMVARHRCRGMGRGEPVIGRCDVHRAGGQRWGHDQAGCAYRAERVDGPGARMGTGRIEADGADCERVVRTRRRRDAHAGKGN